jgi:hypothetical protein
MAFYARQNGGNGIASSHPLTIKGWSDDIQHVKRQTSNAPLQNNSNRIKINVKIDLFSPWEDPRS